MSSLDKGSVSCILEVMNRFSVMALLLAFTASVSAQAIDERGEPFKEIRSIPKLSFYEGTITGKGHNDEYGWLLVSGVSRRLHPDASDFELDYGDWVQVVCSRNFCWVWMFERKKIA